MRHTVENGCAAGSPCASFGAGRTPAGPGACLLDGAGHARARAAIPYGRA